MVEIIKIENEKAMNYRAEVNKVVKCLSNGGIVILPTETVYGIAARQDNRSSVKRLLEIRKSPENKNLTTAIGDLKQLQRHIRVYAPSTQRIIKKFMPGPITVVFDCEDKGIRFPAHKFTSKVLAECDFPVVLPSANLSGEEPKINSKDVIEEFSDKVDIIVDGGITRYKTPSTVIRSGHGILEELRKGVISFDFIRQVAKITILFVCTGNTCRSPLAEIFTKSLLSRKYKITMEELEEFGFNIMSCGIATWDELPASNFAIECAKKYNLDLTTHKTKRIDKHIIENADCIYCMSEEHISYILKLWPDTMIKIKKLRSDGENIDDPALSGYKEYEACASKIKQEVEKIVERL